MDLFTEISDPDLRSFALDAVPLLRTEAGVEFMVDTIKSGELDWGKQEAWFNALALYKNPTKSMIAALAVGKTIIYENETDRL